jgi:glycerol-3-phosphate dehydrogenase
VETPSSEIFATSDDVDYLLEHATRYLSRAPSRADIKSAFAGLRPLPAAKGSTANLRRDHRVEVAGGMVTICGGKWTTYRLMASDAVRAAAREAGLTPRDATLPELAAPPASNARLETHLLSGSGLDNEDALEIQRIARDEMAVSVEDLLARRTRCLFLDARKSAESALAAGYVLASAMGKDAAWVADQVASFTTLAQKYLP